VDSAHFSPEGPIAPRGDQPRLIAVATHLKRDGLETVVRALPDIPEAELIIVGGPARPMLRQDPDCCDLARLAGHLGVADRVKFCGQVSQDDMPALLRSADLMIDVSWYEPFGMASLEAMACGTPVIASAVGGHLDTVVDGTTGLLVNPGQPRALARRIRKLLANPMLLEGFGIASADRAQARYSWERIGRETIAVYTKTQQPVIVPVETDDEELEEVIEQVTEQVSAASPLRKATAGSLPLGTRPFGVSGQAATCGRLVSLVRSVRRARCSRDITVPIGVPIMAAVSWYV
jgi:hypothetical protein